MKILIKFGHGLGDAVQLTSVLNHLAMYHEAGGDQIDVAALRGKHSAFLGITDNVYVLGEDNIGGSQYDEVYDLAWEECRDGFTESPSTKAEKCLSEIFGITPDRRFCDYRIEPSKQAMELASQYLCEIVGGQFLRKRYNVFLIHYQGNTSADKKNLDHQVARNACEKAMALGYVPVVLDWDNRSPLPDGRIFCPDASHWLWRGHGTGDAEMLAALIAQSAAFVGVDSGPQKVAGATNTPSLAVWTKHHPIHYYGLSDNVHHLVPENHLELTNPESAAFFMADDNYSFSTYRDVNDGIQQWIESTLSNRFKVPSEDSQPMVFHQGVAIRSDYKKQDITVVDDVFVRDAYSVDHLPMPVEHVVDVGAHIGSFAAKWRQRNPSARIICVEACLNNIEALKSNVGAYAEVVHAACTYADTNVALLNSFGEDCQSTGGSRVVPADSLHDQPLMLRGHYEFTHDDRPLEKVTLESLMDDFKLPRIDVLKLDCEGGEFSILANCKKKTLKKIRYIVGEYHGLAEFRALLESRFADWDCQLGLPDKKHDENGPFWLFNPRR